MAGTLGRYRLIAELGRGGMGTVYLAVVRGPARFSKLMVVKQLRPDLAGDVSFTDMFLEEARLAARLHHPNIVQTNEVVCDAAEGHFIVMEYLEGASLKRVVGRLRARGEESARKVYARAILDVLTALQYAHNLKDFDGTPLNLVHRDVNPDNVLVLQTGEVKLLDFGIAKAADSTQETRVGMLKGKLHYMSPEQMAGDEIDGRGDIFAVGTMLWDALTGHRLWEGVKGLDIMTALAKGTIASPRSVRPDVPEELDRICVRALALRPADRYPDVSAFRADLERAWGADVMSNADLGATMAAEFLEEQERMRALIGEQLQSTDDAPGGSVPNLDAAGAGTPSLHTGVSSRGTQTRDALALQTSARPVSDVEPLPAREPRGTSWVAVLAFLGVGGLLFWALRTHVIIVNTAPTATAVPAGQDSSRGPEPSAETASAATLDRSPPTASASAAPADSAEARVPPRGRRWPRREAPAPPQLALAPRLSVPERSATSGPGNEGGSPASAQGSTALAAAAPTPEPAAVGAASAPAMGLPLAAPGAVPGPSMVRGSMPNDAVQAVIRAHSDDIQRCFDRAEMDQLYLKVHIAMSAAVGPDGHVQSVNTSADRDGTSRLQSCIQSAVQTWTFPQPAGGVPGHVARTFVLE
jgi:hypothetical protein